MGLEQRNCFYAQLNICAFKVLQDVSTIHMCQYYYILFVYGITTTVFINVYNISFVMLIMCWLFRYFFWSYNFLLHSFYNEIKTTNEDAYPASSLCNIVIYILPGVVSDITPILCCCCKIFSAQSFDKWFLRIIHLQLIILGINTQIKFFLPPYMFYSFSFFILRSFSGVYFICTLN